MSDNIVWQEVNCEKVPEIFSLFNTNNIHLHDEYRFDFKFLL